MQVDIHRLYIYECVCVCIYIYIYTHTYRYIYNLLLHKITKMTVLPPAGKYRKI